VRIRGAQTKQQEPRIGRRRPQFESRDKAMALRKIPMFADCSRAQLQLLDSLMCEVPVPRGRVLLREGRPADQMLVIVSGRARISRGAETLGTAEPGACFGGRELRSRTPNPVTMTAETPMVVRAASAREFPSLLTSVPLLEFVGPPAIRLPASETVERRPLPAHSTRDGSRAERQDEAAPSVGATRLRGIPPDSEETVVDEIEAFLQHDSARDSGRVLAALMFTDIVGSTIHLTTLGDGAWHALLDAHDSIIGQEVLRHRGTLVNFLGDGALARFDCANSAVHCALAVRDAVRDLGIDIRAGLHVGEVDLRGSDISGIAVHVASRICDIADSGCVLASQTLVDLVAGSGLVFEDAGTHMLRGVGGEWSLLAAAG
jgi:class 3 adenylate cyclase